jgi:hypothetical protein
MEIPLDFYPTQRASSCGFLMPSSSVLSGLKDGKAIGVIDEDAPEEPVVKTPSNPFAKQSFPVVVLRKATPGNLSEPIFTS